MKIGNDDPQYYIYFLGAGMTRAAYPEFLGYKNRNLRPREYAMLSQKNNNAAGLDPQLLGAPLTNELLKHGLFFDPIDDPRYASSAMIKQAQYNLRNFLEELNFESSNYQIEDNTGYSEMILSRSLPHVKTDLMDLLTFLELQIKHEKLEFGDETPIGQLFNYETVKLETHFLIANLLASRLGTETSYLDNKFVSHLIKKGADGKKIIIVTFNYDLTVDNAIYHGLKSYNLENGKQIKFSYAIDNPQFVEVRSADNTSETYIDEHLVRTSEPENYINDSEEASIIILKPHGSLNWLVCQSCSQVFITWGFKINAWISDHEPKVCPSCKNKGVTSSLITPSFLQDSDRIPHNAIFKQIAKYSYLSNKYRFIGYSMPESDYSFRQILRDAMRQKGEILDLYVVNGSLKLKYDLKIITEGGKGKEVSDKEEYRKEIEKEPSWKSYQRLFQLDMINNFNDNPLRFYFSDFYFYFKYCSPYFDEVDWDF